MDPDSDKKISEHVLRMHKYRNPGEQDGYRKNFDFEEFKYFENINEHLFISNYPLNSYNFYSLFLKNYTLTNIDFKKFDGTLT